MGILLRDLFADIQESRFSYGSGTITLKYKKKNLSPAMMQHLFALQALPRGNLSNQQVLSAAETLCTILAELLLSWDLLLEPGVMYPIAAEELMKLPITFLMAVAEATQGESVGEATPGETTNNNSDAILPRQAESAKSRSGIPTLKPVIGSMSRPGNFSRRGRPSAKIAGLKRSS